MAYAGSPEDVFASRCIQPAHILGVCVLPSSVYRWTNLHLQLLCFSAETSNARARQAGSSVLLLSHVVQLTSVKWQDESHHCLPCLYITGHAACMSLHVCLCLCHTAMICMTVSCSQGKTKINASM